MASKASGISEIAERYAAAIFELATEKAEIDGVADDFRRIQAMVEDSGDLKRLLKSPIFSRKEQALAMAALAKKAEFSDITTNFIALAARNRRLFMLSDVIDRFFERLSEQRGEVKADVLSAAALNESQMASLQDSLKKTFGKEVSLHTSVDASLIGGLIVRVGSRMIDSSLRTKIQKLQLAMKGIG